MNCDVWIKHKSDCSLPEKSLFIESAVQQRIKKTRVKIDSAFQIEFARFATTETQEASTVLFFEQFLKQSRKNEGKELKWKKIDRKKWNSVSKQCTPISMWNVISKHSNWMFVGICRVNIDSAGSMHAFRARASSFRLSLTFSLTLCVSVYLSLSLSKTIWLWMRSAKMIKWNVCSRAVMPSLLCVLNWKHPFLFY